MRSLAYPAVETKEDVEVDGTADEEAEAKIDDGHEIGWKQSDGF